MIKDGPILRERRKYREKLAKKLEKRKAKEVESPEQREERERDKRWDIFCKNQIGMKGLRPIE